VLIPLLTIPIVATGALLVRASRGLAICVAALALLPPCWPHALPLLRLVCGIGAVAGLARVLDIEATAPAYARVLRALTIVDWCTARRAPRRVEPRRLAAGVAYGAIAAGSLVALLHERPGPLWPGWLLGALAMWSLTETANAVVLFFTAAAGVTLAPLHRTPLASRSLAELWGQRWNLTVTRWLHEHVFRPLARRGHPRLGVLAAFLVSAAFHAYLAAAAGGAACALFMGSFFVVQGLLVVLERALRLRGRAWFLAAILLPSPLFTEPMIAILKPSASPLTRAGSKTLPVVLHE